MPRAAGSPVTSTFEPPALTFEQLRPIPTAQECIEQAYQQRISSPAASQACSALAIAIGLQSVVDALDEISRRLGSMDNELEAIRFSIPSS